MCPSGSWWSQWNRSCAHPQDKFPSISKPQWTFIGPLRKLKEYIYCCEEQTFLHFVGHYSVQRKKKLVVYGQHNQQIIWPSGQLLTRKQSKIGGAFMACLAMPAFLNFELHHSATVALKIPTHYCWATASASLGGPRVSLAQEAQSCAQCCSSLYRWYL